MVTNGAASSKETSATGGRKGNNSGKRGEAKSSAGINQLCCSGIASRELKPLVSVYPPNNMK